MTPYEIVSVVFSSIALLGTIVTFISKFFKTKWLKVTLDKGKSICADYFERYIVTAVNIKNSQHTIVKAVLCCEGKEFNSSYISSIQNCFGNNTVLGAGESKTLVLLFPKLESTEKRTIKFITDQANVVLKQTQDQPMHKKKK